MKKSNKYQLKYSFEQGEFTSEGLDPDKDGLCDDAVFISIVKQPDGGVTFLCCNVPGDPDDEHPGRLFQAIGFLANHILKDPESNPRFLPYCSRIMDLMREFHGVQKNPESEGEDDTGKAQLRDWRIHLKRLYGKVYNDPAKRFEDGTEICTSRVIGFDYATKTATTKRGTKYVLVGGEEQYSNKRLNLKDDGGIQ
jgi:hypothetical protein